MSQLVVIHENCAKRKVERGVRKTEAEDHAIQPIGDIIGVLEDNYQFDPTEQDIFEIIQVSDCVKEQLVNALPTPEREDIYKSETTEWTFEAAEKKETWKDTDDKWYFLEKRPKFLLSIANLTQTEKQDLIEKSFIEKEFIIAKFKNRIKDYPENFVEVTDLNK